MLVTKTWLLLWRQWLGHMWLPYLLLIWLDVWFECVQVCYVYAGMAFEVKIEADSNDVIEHPYDGKPRPYLCTVCDKRFTTKKHLKQHKQTHTADKLHSCTQCEKRFATKYYLNKHMNVHSSKYKCTECEKCFISNRDLTVHRRIHSGEKPFNVLFVANDLHDQTTLLNTAEFTVERNHTNALSVTGHLVSLEIQPHMRVHMGDKPYKCSLYDKSFTTSSQLQSHKRHVHSNRRPYDCRYCGKMFKSSHNLKDHVYTHTGAKPYSCRHCSDCFRQIGHLKRHLLKSHNEGAWFTCHICQKKFSHGGSLKDHVLRHEGMKPYVCDECSKSFCTAFELKSHQLKHSDYKQFCCGSCGKYYKYKQYVLDLDS